MRILLFGLIIVLFVYILYKYGNIKKEIQPVSRATVIDEIVLTDADKKIINPTHVPVYTINDEDNVLTADYSNVPSPISNKLIPLEKPETVIKDNKIPIEDTIDPTKPMTQTERDILEQEKKKEVLSELLVYGNENDNTENVVKFIESLKIDKSCTDAQPELCEKWKLNNECIINPEHMLKNCPSACGTCKWTQSEINLVTNIYNHRENPNCVSHGGYVM